MARLHGATFTDFKVDGHVTKARMGPFPAGALRDDQVFDGALQGTSAEPMIVTLARYRGDDMVCPHESDAGRGEAFARRKVGKFLARDGFDFAQVERLERNHSVQPVEEFGRFSNLKRRRVIAVSSLVPSLSF